MKIEVQTSSKKYGSILKMLTNKDISLFYTLYVLIVRINPLKIGFVIFTALDQSLISIYLDEKARCSISLIIKFVYFESIYSIFEYLVFMFYVFFFIFFSMFCHTLNDNKVMKILHYLRS